MGVALSAYEVGRSRMAVGDFTGAADAFGRASAADPNSALLVAWQARAVNASGRAGAAQSLLSAGIAGISGAGWLRYDRAALRAKGGALEGAAVDLRWLYANDLANPIKVGEDPDFVALRTDATLKALVPQAQVEASVQLENSPVLVGERYVLDFRITSRSGVKLELTSLVDHPEAWVVERIVEDVTDTGPIWSRRRLRVEVLATQAGRIVVGPWLVRSGATSTITERVIVEALALEGRRLGDLDGREGLTLEFPSTRWRGVEQPFLGIKHDGGWAVFPAAMDFRPSVQVLGPRMEFRLGGQPEWMALKVSAAAGAAIWSQGERVMESID